MLTPLNQYRVLDLTNVLAGTILWPSVGPLGC